MSKFYMAQLGDVHLGHPKTPTAHIVENLDRMFPDDHSTAELDMIVIEGDLFDRLLTLNEPDVPIIDRWASRFLKRCKRYDITLVVLEGTPSHDWRQPSRLVELNEMASIGCDLHYIDTLCIRYFERFNRHFLFIPDEWSHTADDTWEQVVKCLNQHGLEKIDFTVMHGVFHFQMPRVLHHRTDIHFAERYLSITRHAVCIGHHHTHTTMDRICAAGSVDRLTHGDEVPKGHVRHLIQDNREDIREFIENTNAMRYVTIDCVGIDADNIQAHIEGKIQTLPEGSHIRILARKTEPGMAALSYLEKIWYQYHWTAKVYGSEDKKVEELLVDTRPMHGSISLTINNIESLLIQRIQNKHPSANIAHAEQLLKEVMNG